MIMTTSTFTSTDAHPRPRPCPCHVHVHIAWIRKRNGHGHGYGHGHRHGTPPHTSTHHTYKDTPTPAHKRSHTHTKNVTNGKRKIPFVYCKRKTETANFRSFAANGNGKQMFVVLGLQTINGNRRLMFQPTCPSMAYLGKSVKSVCTRITSVCFFV